MFDSILDIVFGTSRERELEAQVVRLTAERDDARRQLQNIRVAHEPLHRAIFPGIERK